MSTTSLRPLPKALKAANLFSAIDKIKELSSKAKHALKEEIKETAHHVAQDLKANKDAIILAYQEPKALNMLKACGYSFGTMYNAIFLAQSVASKGALSVIAHLVSHHGMHKAAHHVGHKAGHKLDAAMDKYPILKKVTGPALAGLMLYGYTLTEPHKLGDWNMGAIKKAFAGEYSVKEFIQSAEAVSLTAHVASGKVLSLASLANSTTTLALGLACTCIIHSDHPKLKEMAEKAKSAMSSMLSKKSVLAEQKLDEGVKVPPPPNPTELADGWKGDKPKADKPVNDKEKDKQPSNPGWWQKLSDEAKENYRIAHPGSNMASAQILASVTKRLRSKLN